MPKAAPPRRASATKRSAKRPAVAKKTTKAKAPSEAAIASADELLERVAKAARLSRDEVLRRAVNAFAAAHGLALELRAEAPAVEKPAAVTPAAETPAAKAAPAPAAAQAPVDDSDAPSLGPAVRLYVHGSGRPPQEMIADTFFIGSSSKSDLWVNMPKIDTKHLRINREGTKYLVTDLSTSGTILHGEQVPPGYELKHEDTLFLAGYHKVRFYLLGE